jgi:hypothetical protein
VSWELLAELVWREAEVVDSGDWHGLLALQAERQQVIASVTGPPPPEVVVAARRRSLATEAALRHGLDETARQLGALRRGRLAVHAYARGERAGLDTSA